MVVVSVCVRVVYHFKRWTAGSRQKTRFTFAFSLVRFAELDISRSAHASHKLEVACRIHDASDGLKTHSLVFILMLISRTPMMAQVDAASETLRALESGVQTPFGSSLTWRNSRLPAFKLARHLLYSVDLLINGKVESNQSIRDDNGDQNQKQRTSWGLSEWCQLRSYYSCIRRQVRSSLSSLWVASFWNSYIMNEINN